METGDPQGVPEHDSVVFRWLRKSGRRNDDPSLDVPRVKKPRAHPRPCPDKYIRAAMEMATPSERLMIRLGAECGLRRGEIAAVHSDDVVADSIGHSLIVRGKGDKQRIVPLPDDLATAVMDVRGYLSRPFGGHVEESYIGDHVSHLLPAGYAAHTLRHRFATTAYAATHDLFVVAELLGHESVETTEHYVAMPDGRLREATAAVRLIRPRGVPRAVLSWCEPPSSRRCPSSSTRWRCRLSMRGLRAA